MRIAGRSMLALCAALVLLITGGGWSYLRATDSGFTRVAAGLDENREDVLDSHAQLGDENYLIVGTDTRAGKNAEVGAGSIEDAEGARADTVMLIHVPKNRERVVAVSFPRDLDVNGPACKGWDNAAGQYTEEQSFATSGEKINATYARGGPKCLVKVIRKMSGLDINHFIAIDFAGFETMVQEVGGVEVCVNKPLIDGELGTILEKAGKQKISGKTALDFVRARKVYGDIRGDYDRIHRQQTFLASLLRSALSTDVLLDLGKLNRLIDAFKKATFMDQNLDTRVLLNLGRSLQGVDAGAVTFITIPTAGTTDYGNEIPRESGIKALFQAIIHDLPLPGEKKKTNSPTPTTTAPEPPKIQAVAPSSVSVLVSNGSGRNGEAAKTANLLSNQSFQIYDTGNFADGRSSSTKVRYPSGMEADAATLASSLTGASLEEDDSLNGVVELVIGTDFTGKVTTPTATGKNITGVKLTPTSPTEVELPDDLEHVNAGTNQCQ